MLPFAAAVFWVVVRRLWDCAHFIRGDSFAFAPYAANRVVHLCR